MLESIQKQSEEQLIQQAIQASSNHDLEDAQLKQVMEMSRGAKEESKG